VAVPVAGFVLASRRPANRIGWLFLVAGVALGLFGFSNQYALRALVAGRGSWPAGQVFGWLSNWVWVIQIAVLAFVFLLFPTGRLSSRRWRPAAWFAGGAFALLAADALVIATHFWSDPFSSQAQSTSPPARFLILVPAALLISVAAVVVRFARSSGEERLQLKWFAAAALLVVATFIASIVGYSAAASVRGPRGPARSRACGPGAGPRIGVDQPTRLRLASAGSTTTPGRITKRGCTINGKIESYLHVIRAQTSIYVPPQGQYSIGRFVVCRQAIKSGHH